MVSAGFKFLCKSDLEESEAKEMASKNIMLNVFSIHKQILRAILGNKILQDKHGLVKEKEMSDVRKDLIVSTDRIISNILINLADSYPQAPASGGTPRMREVITEVNRVDDS